MVSLPGLVATALQFPVLPSDALQRYLNPTGYQTYIYGGNVWQPSEPSLGLGESFWLNTTAPRIWARTFSVWP